MSINTLFRCSQEESPLHDFLLFPAIFRSLGAHPAYPHQKPKTEVPRSVGGKEEDWRSLLLSSVEQTLGDAHPVSLWSSASTWGFFQRNSAVCYTNSVCLKGKHILGLRK